MPITYVRNQIAFGCELPINFDSLENIKKQRLDHLNASNFWWHKLVSTGVAEVKRRGQIVSLRRGPNWKSFYDTYGYSDTKESCLCIDINQDIDKIFLGNGDFMALASHSLL